jgi:hypothetical protein
MELKNWLALAAGALVCVAFSASPVAAKKVSRHPAGFECTAAKMDVVDYVSGTNEWPSKVTEAPKIVGLQKFAISGLDDRSTAATVSRAPWQEEAGKPVVVEKPVLASVEHWQDQLVLRYDYEIGPDLVIKNEITLIGPPGLSIRPFFQTFTHTLFETPAFTLVYGTCLVTSWQLPGTSSAPPNAPPSSSPTPVAAPVVPTPTPSAPDAGPHVA